MDTAFATARDIGGATEMFQLSPQAPPRTLVLCFDGTAGQYDNENTNVVKLFALLTKDPNVQLCYYQPGIGTWFKPGIVSPIMHSFAVLMDKAIAWYLDQHVMDGYKFVMQNYRAGDKICLFGFSRGAYTARALAGMLHKMGLLPRDNDEQLPFAYKLYQREDEAGLAMCAGFKQTYCQHVSIEFVGVWDTVASVGVVMGRSLPFTNSNSSIKIFRHAMSLDEHRARYRPNLYHRIPGPGEQSAGADDVLEVWFSGCHADVGGGSVANTAMDSLSDISLRWMLRQALSCGSGIKFDKEALAQENIGQEDSVDAVQVIYDPLKTIPPWWILELVPMQYEWQDGEGAWHKSWGWNLGRGRSIETQNPRFHESVKIRKDQLKYTPRAKWDKGTEVYVK